MSNRNEWISSKKSNTQITEVSFYFLCLNSNIIIITEDMIKDLLTCSYQKGYGLFLHDGNNWWITGNDESIKIVNEFASIMKLEECLPDGLPKLILYRSNHNHSLMSSELNSPNLEAGWKLYNHETTYIWHNTSSGDVISEFKSSRTKIDKYTAMWLSLQPICRKNIQMGGLPFHSGLIEHEGRGILLAATGGTGKSTCCRRLPDHWRLLCDDEVLIILDNNKKYCVHPLPTWKDYILNNYTIKREENKWDVQYSVPLSAIFFLEQSEKDEAIPIPTKKVPFFITELAFSVMDKKWINKTDEEKIELVSRIFNNAFDIAKVTPAFHLRVSLNGRFWEEIEKVMGL
jgi:SynChlorMet cassette protein ScmC